MDFKMTIRKKLFLSFLIIIVLYSLMLIMAFQNIQQVRELGEEIVPLNDEAMALQKLTKNLGDFEKSLDQFLIVQNIQSQEQAKAALLGMNTALSDLEIADGDTSEGEQKLNNAVTSIKTNFETFQIVNAQVTVSNSKLIAVYKDIKNAYTLTNELLDENSKEVEEIVDMQHELIAKTSNQFIILGIITSIIAIVLGLFLGHKISGPLVKLTKSGNAVAEGKLDENIPVFNTRDEIGDLSNTMNMLVGALKFLKQEKDKPKTEEKSPAKKTKVKK